MPLWRRRDAGGSEDLNRQSQQELQEHHIPTQARLRLERSDGAWGSTLSAPGLLSARRAQLEPIGQVMGSSVMHVGYSGSWLQGGWREGDIRPLSRVMSVARQNAVERMKIEARLLGADGVIQMQVEQKRSSWGSGLLEFQAAGTAVRYSAPLPLETPFICNLPAADTMALLAAGFLPIEWVWSTTAYYVLSTWGVERAEMSWSNQEISPYSQAVYRAREFVMAEIRQQAKVHGALGIIAADWHMGVETVRVNRPRVDGRGAVGMMVEAHDDHIIHLTLSATAIREYAPDRMLDQRIHLGFPVNDQPTGNKP